MSLIIVVIQGGQLLLGYHTYNTAIIDLTAFDWTYSTWSSLVIVCDMWHMAKHFDQTEIGI